MRFRVVVAGVVIAIGLAGCSGEVKVGTESSPPATAEQSPAASVPADVQTYTSDKYGFSFQYAPPFEMKGDTSWEAESGASSADSVAVFDTEGTQVGGQYRDAFVVNVYELNLEITQENLKDVQTELEQSVIPSLEKSSTDMQISELTPVTVGGVNGYQADATFSVEGTPMTSQLYFLFDGKIEYQLLTQSATDRWDELQPTFQQMVDSFTVN
ncbi:MAG TPA: PsbP-related protein [Actinomycetota bacterium]|nr:PsbP-related protein [Actinomycetota bacterium]